MIETQNGAGTEGPLTGVANSQGFSPVREIIALHDQFCQKNRFRVVLR
jgi:hypothetical protein